MPTELEWRWKGPGQYISKRFIWIFLEPHLSAAICGTGQRGRVPGGWEQPLVVHGNPASGKAPGGERVGAKMMLLAVPAWMCQCDLCINGSGNTPWWASAANSEIESYSFQERDLAGEQIHCWKQYKSPSTTSFLQVCHVGKPIWTELMEVQTSLHLEVLWLHSNYSNHLLISPLLLSW